MINCEYCKKRIGLIKRLMGKDYQAIVFEGEKNKGKKHFCSSSCAISFLNENDVITNDPIRLGLRNYYQENLSMRALELLRNCKEGDSIIWDEPNGEVYKIKLEKKYPKGWKPKKERKR